MPYTIEHYTDRVEWLNARGIGGSSAAAIVNQSKWLNKVDVLRDLVCEIESEGEQNEIQKYGNRCEGLLIALFDYDHPNYRVLPQGMTIYRSKKNTLLTLTPDALLEDDENNLHGGLEIKTHDVRGHQDEEEWNGQIPQNYYIQCLHYFVVKDDLDFVILCAKLRYHNYQTGEITKQEIRYYCIDKNDEQVKKDIQYLYDKETEFYYLTSVKKEIPSIEI